MASRQCEGYNGKPAAVWDCWKDAIVKKTGGFWYSTTSMGYCGDGSGGGADGSAGSCTWRVAEVVKRVAKNCSGASIFARVEAEGHRCFEHCNLGPSRNVSDACWIHCFYNTVLGPGAAVPHGVVAGMPLADLHAAWDKPFAPQSEGGCPEL